MRFFGFLHPSQILGAFITVALISSPALAQDSNAYRAEIVLLERKIDSGSIAEQMASRHPEVADAGKQLWVIGQDGQRRSDLELVPRSELSLNNAVQRLEQSGRYRVLASAGWYQSFPPDYKGEPLRIEVGDWLEEAGHREIEGTIRIDRVRFLHVSAKLNHWQPATGGDMQEDALAANAMPQQTRKELVTWIRETRRMRSEEIHFMDSPTLGVLIFFKKLENAEGSNAPVN